MPTVPTNDDPSEPKTSSPQTTPEEGGTTGPTASDRVSEGAGAITSSPKFAPMAEPEDAPDKNGLRSQIEDAKDAVVSAKTDEIMLRDRAPEVSERITATAEEAARIPPPSAAAAAPEAEAAIATPGPMDGKATAKAFTELEPKSSSSVSGFVEILDDGPNAKLVMDIQAPLPGTYPIFLRNKVGCRDPILKSELMAMSEAKDMRGGAAIGEVTVTGAGFAHYETTIPREKLPNGNLLLLDRRTILITEAPVTAETDDGSPLGAVAACGTFVLKPL